MKKIGIQSLIGALSLVLALFVAPTTAMAATSEQPTATTEAPATIPEAFSLEVELNEFDFSQPFTFVQYVANADGELITVEHSFVPAPQTRGTSSNPASPGTWTSSVNYGVISMSYMFDLAHGTQWTISNARNHAYSGLFTTFSNPSLTISRATSTNTYAAEINARVDATLFDTQWVKLYSGTWLMSTTVTSGGTMTLTWN